MSSEHKSTGSEQAELASYRIWEKVERRLWSRARLILLGVVVGIVLVVLLGVPLVRDSIEERVIEQARAIVGEELETERLDLAALRQEFRQDTQFARAQFIESSVDLETQLGGLILRAEELQATYADLGDQAHEIDSVRTQAQVIHQRLKNDQERLHSLRTEYERELHQFTREAERLTTNAPKVIESELGRVERIIERELDELRLLLADHMAGKPAMFSTYFDADDRLGQLTGANFGVEPGRVFLRVRAFLPGAGEPKAESDSIVLPPSFWGDSKIEIRLTARSLEQIAEAEARVAETTGPGTQLRHGFMIQTADGLMSQWSGLRADSVVPPERLSAVVD